VVRTRLLTAAIVLPIVLAIIVGASAPEFTIFIAVVVSWGLYEVAEMNGARTIGWLGIGLCGALPALLLLVLGRGPWFPPAGVITLLSALTVAVGITGPGRKSFWVTALGALGVGVLFPYFAFLRNAPRGVTNLIVMLLIVIASDSGAFFVGRALGRLKLLPKVSPHKTVEGAIGGLAASVIVGIILCSTMLPTLSLREAIALGGVVALLAQTGDLANSACKRIAGVKDSGWIFPGHGGLLDRTCSLVFPAVFTYYYLS
jgi:phosphatidate cytidylyltransferase